MSTIFIAVQCYQCSTMQAPISFRLSFPCLFLSVISVMAVVSIQVKQQRRSGYKWICAVCNEKQSVQKVFARASMAKDVRKFVQSFNMSRKYADEQTKVDELLDGGTVDDDPLDCSARRKRRSDWREYLDLEEDRSQSEGETEREIGSDFADGKTVTLFPEVKTRKSGSTSRSSWSEDGEGEGLYRPVFSKRKHIAKSLISQDEIRNWESPSAIHASKWSKGVSKDDEKVICKAKYLSSKDETRNEESPSNIQASEWSTGISKDDENARTKTCILAKVRGPSKWSEYITEEDNHRAENGENMATEQSMDIFKTMINDDIVEDDIHPDFK